MVIKKGGSGAWTCAQSVINCEWPLVSDAMDADSCGLL